MRPPINEVIKAIEGWHKDIYNRWEPHDIVGKYVRRIVKATFRKQSTVDGAAWPSLKPASIKRKLRSGNLLQDPSKALLHTGRLRRSIKYRVIGVRRFGKPKVLLSGSSRATVTRISPEMNRNRMVEARVQQGKGLGTFIRSGPGKTAKIPSRPYMGMSDHMNAHVQRVFMTYISNSLHLRIRRIRG